MCLTLVACSFQATTFSILTITETESALELCYISFVDFFIKSLHFFGKFIPNIYITTSKKYITMWKAEETLGPNFP